MDKRQLKASAAVWQSRQNQLIYETGRFTLDLSGLSHTDLLGLPWVTEEDIAYSVFALTTVAPRLIPELKHAISYMTELHERQQEAFAKEVEVTDNHIYRIQRKLAHEPV